MDRSLPQQHISNSCSRWSLLRQLPSHIRVPQGSVLCPAPFLLYINDLPDTIDSQRRLFADGTVLYRTITSDSDHHGLQTDLDQLTEWAMAWDIQLHAAKCIVMNISKKRHPSKLTYSLHNIDLWSTFKQGIITGVEKYIPHKFAKERNGKPWVNKPLQRLIAKRNRHYSKYSATGSRYHKDKYKQTKAQVQKGIRSSYWAYVEDNTTSQETQAAHGKCNKKFWSFIKHSRKESMHACIDLKTTDTAKYLSVKI